MLPFISFWTTVNALEPRESIRSREKDHESDKDDESAHEMFTKKLDNTFGGFEELFSVHAFGGVDINIRASDSMEVSSGGHDGVEKEDEKERKEEN